MSDNSFCAQARICPICFDDHFIDSKCNPVAAGEIYEALGNAEMCGDIQYEINWEEVSMKTMIMFTCMDDLQRDCKGSITCNCDVVSTMRCMQAWYTKRSKAMAAEYEKGRSAI